MVYGSFGFPANALNVSVGQTAVENQFGWPYKYAVAISVSGRFNVVSQADAVAQELSLQSALRVTGQTLSFLRDDGGPTVVSFGPANTLGGVVISRGPDFPSQPAQYATVRDFTFTASCEVPINNARTAVMSWTDSMRYTGGGPVKIHRPSMNSPAQKQLVWPSTAYRIEHSGSAVGYFDYPFMNPLMETMSSPTYRRRSPKSTRGTLTEFPLDWEFVYESVGQLELLPVVYNPK